MSQQEQASEKPHGQDKQVTIYINTRATVVEDREISFEQLAELAFPGLPTGPNIVYTVNYRNGHGNKHGSLIAGESVRVKDGMIFDVTRTDKS